jgi:hypothetical protein
MESEYGAKIGKISEEQEAGSGSSFSYSDVNQFFTDNPIENNAIFNKSWDFAASHQHKKAGQAIDAPQASFHI